MTLGSGDRARLRKGRGQVELCPPPPTVEREDCREGIWKLAMGPISLGDRVASQTFELSGMNWGGPSEVS